MRAKAIGIWIAVVSVVALAAGFFYMQFEQHREAMFSQAKDRIVRENKRDEELEEIRALVLKLVGTSAAQAASGPDLRCAVSKAVIAAKEAQTKGNERFEKALELCPRRVALARYQASIAIAESLVKADPNNWKWQHDLSFVFSRVAGIHFSARRY